MHVKIVGENFQYLVIELGAYESFYAEPGALRYYELGIISELETQRSIFGAKFSGESAFICKYSNPTSVPLKLHLCGSKQTMIPIKLSKGHFITARSRCYFASKEKVEILTKLSWKFFKSGMGLSFQKIVGDTTIFIDSNPNTEIKELGSGETIVIDENHILAFEDIGDHQIVPKYRWRNLFKHEGLSTLEIHGPGKVYITAGTLSLEERASSVGIFLGCVIWIAVIVIFVLIWLITLK